MTGFMNGGNKLKIRFFSLEHGLWFYDHLPRLKTSDWKEKKNTERGIRKMKKKNQHSLVFLYRALRQEQKMLQVERVEARTVVHFKRLWPLLIDIGLINPDIYTYRAKKCIIEYIV